MLEYEKAKGSIVAKPELRNRARTLRSQGWSIRDIVHETGAAKSSVSLWVRDIELTDGQYAALKRQQKQWGGRNKGAQVNREQARQQRLAYQNAGRERTKNGSRLHLTGCMLYWAEGSKTKKNVVHFVNSDPHMLTLFMRFLRDEFEVRDEECRLQIHCHTTDPNRIRCIEGYWLDLLQLPETCLQKTQIKQGSHSRKNRLENGVCALQVFRTELVQHIYGAIQEYGSFDNPDWLF